MPLSARKSKQAIWELNGSESDTDEEDGSDGDGDTPVRPTPHADHCDICHHLEGHITPSGFIQPPSLERHRQDPSYLLLRAHSLLDALERNPGTSRSASSSSSKKGIPSSDTRWSELSATLNDLVAHIKANGALTLDPARPRLRQAQAGPSHAPSSDAAVSQVQQDSLDALQRRLYALSVDPYISSKKFLHTLDSAQAKALAVILQRGRAAARRPARQDDFHDKNGTEDSDSFITSLQRTSLYQVVLRYKLADIKRKYANRQWRQRGDRLVSRSTPTTSSSDTDDPVQRALEPFCKVILRSGRRRRSAAELQDILAPFEHCINPGPEVREDRLALQSLYWIHDGDSADGVELVDVLPFLSKQGIKKITVIRLRDNVAARLVPPTLCAFPELRLHKTLNPCAEMAKKISTSSHTNIQYGQKSCDDVGDSLASRANYAEVYQAARLICQARQRNTDGPSASRRPPPSLGALCALVIQAALDRDDASTKTDTLLDEMPPSCRELVKHSYPCVSCGTAVSGLGHTAQDATKEDDEQDAQCEVLPPLIEPRLWPGLRVGADPDGPIVGGRGPWLRRCEDDDDDAAGEPDTERDVEWRFCAPCACAHLEPFMSKSGKRAESHGGTGAGAECFCLLCEAGRAHVRQTVFPR